MPMNRMRPARWLAARRAAKRRGLEQILVDSRARQPEPLPPLVSPDDDREFMGPPRELVPVAHEAAGGVAAMDAAGVVGA
jgi:hypothetical protein